MRASFTEEANKGFLLWGGGVSGCCGKGGNERTFVLRKRVLRRNCGRNCVPHPGRWQTEVQGPAEGKHSRFGEYTFCSV